MDKLNFWRQILIIAGVDPDACEGCLGSGLLAIPVELGFGVISCDDCKGSGIGW